MLALSNYYTSKMTTSSSGSGSGKINNSGGGNGIGAGCSKALIVSAIIGWVLWIIGKF